MSRNKASNRSPREIPMTDLPEEPRSGPAGRRDDPAMRDGNSSRGNPNEEDPEEINTDNDIGDDLIGGPPYAGETGGAVGGTPAEGRSRGGYGDHGISGGETRGDTTLGREP